MEKTEPDEERAALAMAGIKKGLLAHMPGPGIFSTAIPSVGMARRNMAGISEHIFDRPLVSLLVQGAKETAIGDHLFSLTPGQILAVCVDMPASSKLIEASPQEPLLTLYFHINRNLICDLLSDPYIRSGSGSHAGVWACAASADFLEGMLRLIRVLDTPEQIPVRSNMILRELHYLLLINPQSGILRDIYTQGKHGARILGAIDYMRERLDSSIRSADLARAVHMSESSLYRHFKALTGLSPQQYHKNLRLHEARRLLISESEQVSAIAYRAGYESVSQFCRDYKRLFGRSPGQK